MTPNEIAHLRADFLAFTEYMFQARKGVPMMRAKHQDLICTALEKVVVGKTKRLIINIPPRSGKTELAVISFIAWCMGNWPHSQFIHASYSKRLATSNAYAVRSIMQHEAYGAVFGGVGLAGDSKAKDEFRTDHGGLVYATGADGSITGVGAGAMGNSFGGCFAYHQMVKTEKGDIKIGDLVSSKKDCRVWSYCEEAGSVRLSKILHYWKNPANDIIRIAMSDGSHIDCTPDHEILTKAGWVSAIHLAKALNLVDAEPGNLGSLHSAETPVYGNFYDALGVLWLCIPFGVRERLRDRFPSLAGLDLADNANANAVTLCEDGSAFGALEYFNNLFSVEFGSGAALEEWERPVPDSVLHVIGLSAIREIAQVVVGGISVEMPNLIPIGAFTYKLLSDQVRDIVSFNLSTDRKAHSEVSFPVARRLQKSDGFCPSNLSEIRNLVQAGGSGDVFPTGVFYAGHIDATYCLEVECDNNFILSQNGAIVSNCIIIDDPHKAGEALSDVMRANVIDWFGTTMESRKNSPDTPIIVIMQRLHESDLTGFLIGGGNGEKWEVLKVPAMDEYGASFWPAQFPVDMLERLERTNPYVYAGQYMQEPSPRAGGDFKPDNIEIIDALPAGLKFVRGWDLAATTKKTSDYTATTKLAVLDGITYIAHGYRFKGGPDEVERSIVQFAETDTHTEASLPQDPGQAGVAQKQNISKKLQGRRFEFSPETGDKRTRASPLAAQVNVGNVKMLRGDWNNDMLHEMRMFPNGNNDDYVDSASRAYNRAALTKKTVGVILPTRR